MEISGYAAEGKSLAKVEGKVIFVEGAVPGDVADVFITRNKKDWAEGKAQRITQYSSDRVEPFCRHFGICGGCKWQMLPYPLQLKYKEQETRDVFSRIGKIKAAPMLPIVGSEKIIHYRNKLEFTYSNKKYLAPQDLEALGDSEWPGGALGYHVPRLYDKVIDIYECWLMDDVNNRIRNYMRMYAQEHALEYYDIKNHHGFLRNIVVRYCTTGELMVNMLVAENNKEAIRNMGDQLLLQVPEITTLLYTVNTKWNDSIYDLEPQILSGNGYVIEKLGDYLFKISPKSFFQTNTEQAEVLYGIVKEFAALTGKETVYDLYCGTGSIGIFLSSAAGKVIGVETVPEAVADAWENAQLNQLEHTSFFAGDVIDICNNTFFEKHGRPDVVIVDPPRAGLHGKLVEKLLEIAPPRIVYVSCNVATQARDLALLAEKYEVIKLQPVDMFPHTHHIECVAKLELRTDLP